MASSPLDVVISRRIRQNHALEHATVTILSGMIPGLQVTARSNNRGFTIFADLDLGKVRAAVDEALFRLQAGEADLAIHPQCGTNLAVGSSLALIGSTLALGMRKTSAKLAYAVVASLAAYMVAQPLGTIVQKHVTTLPELTRVHISNVYRKKFLNAVTVHVDTVEE